eukprot:TRINITY_DN46852_c0_g1_i1.p1 TRINITY_DN46852_c0_g1~~TRINITY_DN46852_c0_g1_i1.p1  ORF type:complete len:460 (+),score=145.86 TRINITY_DN46852_c0_g1_i1:75-1382(+)
MPKRKAEHAPIGVLVVGTGEYTTGFVPTAEGAASDKKVGIVGLSLFDLRRLGAVERIVLAGTCGTKFPRIREHFAKNIRGVYCGMDVGFESHPADDVARDPTAYLRAMQGMSPGDCVMIFTPDDTHFDIALAAVRRKLHVLIAKPAVQTLAQHLELAKAADEAGVLVCVEMHKRWDPIYADATTRIRSGALGKFNFCSSYMSQPKKQLRTFAAWAGKSSDINYYLNAHHVDFLANAVCGFARPERVTAMASTGVAEGMGIKTEDTITVMVKWAETGGGGAAAGGASTGHSVHTSSWTAPPSDVHSQQRFFYLGSQGEATVDQAHRGYTTATDAAGFASNNPLFMKYTPDADGHFDGQGGYGYRSLALFVEAARRIQGEGLKPQHFDSSLATARGPASAFVTAIIEAGRRSLDRGGAEVTIGGYRADGLPSSLTPG